MPPTPRGNVTITGDRAVLRTFRELRDRAAHVAPIWRKVGDYFATVARRQFSSSGAYLGRPWAPLNPEYHAWKIAHGFDRRTLRRTGALYRSWTSRPMGTERYGAQTARFGSNVSYAGFHQTGTRFMPARPVLFSNPKMERDVTEILAAYIVDGKVVSQP
jgi:phage gpG-like protein